MGKKKSKATVPVGSQFTAHELLHAERLRLQAIDAGDEALLELCDVALAEGHPATSAVCMAALRTRR